MDNKQQCLKYNDYAVIQTSCITFSIIVIENLRIKHLYYTSWNHCILYIIPNNISISYIQNNHHLNALNIEVLQKPSNLKIPKTIYF